MKTGNTVDVGGVQFVARVHMTCHGDPALKLWQESSGLWRIAYCLTPPASRYWEDVTYFLWNGLDWIVRGDPHNVEAFNSFFFFTEETLPDAVRAAMIARPHAA
jgi:hypothetical protein